MTGDVQSARLEWEDAHRRLEEAVDDERTAEVIGLQLDAVTAELRRRVGGVFTLGELVEEYARAEVWAREALAELGIAGWAKTLSLVEGAAFHLYSRGAVDYQP